ncbi:ERF family protein [Candidatus Bipolaricaulota bacterium]|nr:ERF family protein [Candidatus Bipolaricaulota bacterium]
MEENKKNLVKALLEVQKEIENPKNTEINPYYRSKYAPLPDILNLVRPLLAKNGLVLYQDVGSTKDGAVCVRTHLIHESGESLSTSPLYMKPEARHKEKGKPTPQAIGSAITYARRYQILALLGIASEDDDANLASRPPKPGR